MRKKNIAFITPIYLPAPLYGSDNAVRILAEDFVGAGHTVFIITSDALTPRYWYDPFFGKKISNNDSINTINGVHIIRLKSRQLVSASIFILLHSVGFLLPLKLRNFLEIISNGPYLAGLGEILKLKDIDVVHCSPFPLNINKQVIDSIATLKKKPKVIFTPFFHTRVSTYHNQELRRLISHADVIHAVSFAEKSDLELLFPEIKGKVIVIPLYLRLSHIHSLKELQHDQMMIKKKYHLMGKKIVLFAGLKGQMKGALDTLFAVEKLHKNDPNIFLIAIGHSTEEWKAMKKKISPKSLLDFDYVDEYTKELFFSICDVFCMPSKSDSFGLVYLEAWHKQKPVIAADMPAMSELIKKNKGGFLVPYADLITLQSTIARLVSNTVLSKKFGKYGYNALVQKYTIEKQFPAYKKLFDV